VLRYKHHHKRKTARHFGIYSLVGCLGTFLSLLLFSDGVILDTLFWERTGTGTGIGWNEPGQPAFPPSPHLYHGMLMFSDIMTSGGDT